MIWFALVFQVLSEKPAAACTSGAKDCVNKLVDKVVSNFFDHAVWKWRLHHTDLEQSTLGTEPKKKFDFKVFQMDRVNKLLLLCCKRLLPGKSIK